MQPETGASRLRAALEALGVWPASASEQQSLADSLLRYLALLVKWNRIYNLTAVREPERMLVQHIFDCAAVALPLKTRVQARMQGGMHAGTQSRTHPGTQGETHPGTHAGTHAGTTTGERPAAADRRALVVDVGSGAGLPGIVLALLWPGADFVLVEPVGKKAAFIEQVKNELALANVRVARCRVQDLPSECAAPDAIVCRAFASLADFAKAIEPIVQSHTVVAAMKARLEQEEKSALTDGWCVAEELALRVPELDAERSLVFLERAERPL